MSIEEDIKHLREWITPAEAKWITVSDRCAIEALERIDAEIKRLQGAKVHFWAENDKPLCGSDTTRGDSMQKVMSWVTCSACKSIGTPKRSG